MVLVHVYYDPAAMFSPEIGLLSEKLPEIIARNLTGPRNEETFLEAKDVEIHFLPSKPHDVHKRPLGILIEADDSYERRTALKRERQSIHLETGYLLQRNKNKDFRFWVWIRLCPGGGFLEGPLPLTDLPAAPPPRFGS